MSDELFNRLLIDKVHQDPRLLQTASERLRRRFASAWEPAQRVAQTLGAAPVAMLKWWLQHPHGHVLITPTQQPYTRGPVEHGDGSLQCVAALTLEDVPDAARSWRAVAPIFDHLLGCDGAPDGEWLSCGGGITPAWQEVGTRLYAAFQLGYGATPETRTDPKVYFADGLATYLTDRRALNLTDPVLERVLRSTICAEAFWKRSGAPCL